MVHHAAMLAFIFNIAVCFGLPLALTVWLVRKNRHLILPVVTGILVFLVFQVVLRIPLNVEILPRYDWYMQLVHMPWLYGVFLGFTAGLFEEIGRYLGYKTVLHNRRDWCTGFAYGVGHGGIEAIVLVGFANINNLLMAYSINKGSFFDRFEAIGDKLVHRIYLNLTGLEPHDALLAGVERIFVIVIQIAFSILVLQAVRTRRLMYLWLAVILHMVVDAPVVILRRVFGLTAWQIEGYIAACALIALWYLFWSYRQEQRPSA